MEDAQAELVRDPEELEGSLFLPVATAVPGPVVAETVAVAVGATPTTYFNYETVETEDQQQQQQQQSLLVEQHAIAIPSTSSEVAPYSNNHQEQSAFRRGNRIGVIAAEEEKDAIRKANRKVYSQDYFAQQQAKIANSRARLRAQEERLAVQAGNFNSSSNGTAASLALAGAAGGYELELWQQEQASSSAGGGAGARNGSDDNDNKAESTSGSSNTKQNNNHSEREYKAGGGYQVNDYQVGSYDTNEYKVSEYKSVYD